MNIKQHCELNLNLTLENVRSIWCDLDDEKRMEVLKSVIWMAPDNHLFYDKAIKEICSDKFKETLD